MCTDLQCSPFLFGRASDTNETGAPAPKHKTPDGMVQMYGLYHKFLCYRAELYGAWHDSVRSFSTQIQVPGRDVVAKYYSQDTLTVFVCAQEQQICVDFDVSPDTTQKSPGATGNLLAWFVWGCAFQMTASLLIIRHHMAMGILGRMKRSVNRYTLSYYFTFSTSQSLTHTLNPKP